MHRNTLKELERIMRTRDVVKIKRDHKLVQAAVMIILKEGDRGYSILFIKRTENESDVFSGHMAFPGGKMRTPDKDTLDTAIRETVEETGIDFRKSGRIIGELDDFHPNNPKANHYVVTPFLSLLKGDVELTLDHGEVADAVWIPIHHLNDPRNREIRILNRTGGVSEDSAFYYGDYVIWGMTGRILYQFLSLFGKLF
ncbi:MAG: CoA pyrophosphatase [Deltaproteobacteria bacterium]|nr:CoA pyrophosphatase [Deltaproteobacteria bacterium]